jgi:hypothetical protein
MPENSFKVTDTSFNKTEADRIISVISMPKYHHRAWTPKKLRVELSGLGLEYSESEMAGIIVTIKSMGVIADTGETDAVQLDTNNP